MNAVKPAAEPSTAAGKEDNASTKKRSAQLLIQGAQNDDVVVADDGSVPSNTAKRPKQGDDEASQQDKEGSMPQLAASNMTIKTDDIDADDEATQQDEVGPMLQTSDMKTDGIDAPKLGKAASADNLTMTVSESTSGEEDVMVLKFFEMLNSCIEDGGCVGDYYRDIQEMIDANHYLVNAKCPQEMGEIKAGCSAMEAFCCLNIHRADFFDLLSEFVSLGGKATDECYERIMDAGEYYMPLDELLVLLLSGYFPTKIVSGYPKESKFFLDELVDGFEENDYHDEKTYSAIVRILCKDITLEDSFSCGGVNSTIINNINGLPPLVVGETHSEGGPMEKLLTRFPIKRIICSTCKALKLAWQFSEEHKCCYKCERRDFLLCSTCRVSKRRLEHFTAEQSKKEHSACCIDCEVFLVCSLCKASKSKSDGHFSKGQKKKGEAACCKECVNTCLVCSMCKVWKKKSEHFTKSQRNKKVKYAVCRGCEVRAQTLAHTQGTASVNKAGTPVTNVPEKKGGKQRLCSACNISKSYTNFSKNQLGKGEKARCKECVSATH